MEKTLDIPGYKIKKELGAGGMARVYLALDKKLERPVALKVLSSSFVESPRITKRFIKEAKTAAQLQHSNIVSIFDVGKHQGTYYIAMEYLTENLTDRMNQLPAIRPREALSIVKDVAKALSYAHKKGYIHRDIKPDNIMFRKDGAVVLVDFGIVKALNETTKLTRTGMSMGTPQYMSPEQVKAKRVDGRSDLYSLGIVLYEMLTGHVPYKAKDVITLALKHTDEPVPQLPKRLKEYQPLIDKMLAKKPANRVKSGEGLIRLIDALDYKIKTETVKIFKKEAPPPTRKKAPVIFTLLLVVVLMVVSGYLIIESKRKEEAAAWQIAKITGTTASYGEYLKQYPEGKYEKAARQAIEEEKRYPGYRSAFKQAKEYYQLKNYKKAMQKVNEAKKIKITNELKLLEQKIRHALAGN